MKSSLFWFFMLTLWLAFTPQEAAPVEAQQASAPSPGRMKLLSKEIFIRHKDGRPVATGFITYISKTRPVLMHCFGLQDYSDGYDDYAVSLSYDNGKTWTEPQVLWKSFGVPEGKIRYAEPAAFFDPDRRSSSCLSTRRFIRRIN